MYLRSAGIGLDTLSDVLLGDHSEAGPIRIFELVINFCLKTCQLDLNLLCLDKLDIHAESA